MLESPKNKYLICIGTSTGGPRALQKVLSQLPMNLKVPIVIVQHMPPNFTRSLANRLDSLSSIHVKEAEDGEILKGGTAYIAPGGRHMTVIQSKKGIKVKISDTEPCRGHRPSVDILFKSVSHLEDIFKIAVIMTGMGSDGKSGLMKLKQSGNTYAIAESRESCIVYGMPKAVIEADLVDSIVKLDEIAAAIMKKIC